MKRNLTAAICGAGAAMRAFLPLADELSLVVTGVFDNDSAKHGLSVAGVNVLPIDSLARHAEFDLVVVASYAYDEILGQLLELGVPRSKIFSHDIRWDVFYMDRLFYVSQLNENDFSILCNDCLDSTLCNWLMVPFRSPLTETYIEPDHFIRMVGDFDSYLRMELDFFDHKHHVAAMLGDIAIYFPHAKSADDAAGKWDRRLRRMNREKMYVILHEESSPSFLERFHALPIPHKLSITCYPHELSDLYVPELACGATWGKAVNVHTASVRRFNYVKWFNGRPAKECVIDF